MCTSRALFKKVKNQNWTLISDPIWQVLIYYFTLPTPSHFPRLLNNSSRKKNPCMPQQTGMTCNCVILKHSEMATGLRIFGESYQTWMGNEIKTQVYATFSIYFPMSGHLLEISARFILNSPCHAKTGSKVFTIFIQQDETTMTRPLLIGSVEHSKYWVGRA